MQKYFKDRNFLTALFFLVFDLFYLGVGVQIPISDSSSVGAGFMPRVYGLLMLLVVVILLITSVVRIRKESAEESEKKAADMAFDRRDVIRIVGAFVAILAYVVCLREVGFIICSIPLLFILVLLLTPAHVKEAYIQKKCCDASGQVKPECKDAKGKIKFGCMAPYYGKVLLFAVVFTLIINFLFSEGLGLQMPAGILKNILP